jgi:hypothetical protein
MTATPQIMTEADTCRELVTPKLFEAGWGNAPHVIGEQRTFTDGRIIVTGGRVRRGKQKRADYLLYYRRDYPLAVVKAKELGLPAEAGVQQAKEYAEMLGLKFAYATNGHRIIEIDYTTGTEREVIIELEGSYPELGIRSFGNGTFHKPPLSGADVGTKRLFRIEPGDLLFSNVFAWEGAIAVAQPEDAGRFGSHRFITCRVDPEITSPEFLRYYFLTDTGLEKIGEASPGGAGRNRTLGLEKLMAIQVPTPSRSVQRTFDALQAKVAELKARHAIIRQANEALIPERWNASSSRPTECSSSATAPISPSACCRRTRTGARCSSAARAFLTRRACRASPGWWRRCMKPWPSRPTRCSRPRSRSGSSIPPLGCWRRISSAAARRCAAHLPAS